MKTKCSNCGAQFIVAEEYKGKMAKCKKCQKAFQIIEINSNPEQVQETVTVKQNDGVLKKDISTVNETPGKVSIGDSSESPKVKKNKTKTVAGFIVVIILIAIFLPSMLGSHPLKNKTASEVTSMVVKWNQGHLPEQITAGEAGQNTRSIELFYKVFGKPKKKSLMGDNYYFDYDCKEGIVILEVHRKAFDIMGEVFIEEDISMY